MLSTPLITVFNSIFIQSREDAMLKMPFRIFILGERTFNTNKYKL